MKMIPLSMGLSAMVDDCDYDALSRYKWHAAKSKRTFYARRQRRIFSGYGGQTSVPMHHDIVGKPTFGLQIDHINGNGLDNTRDNLRVVTARENSQNYHIDKTSKYPGVSLCKDRKKMWTAHIHSGDTYQKCLGYFYTEEEAHARYVLACNRIATLQHVFTIEPA